MQTFGYGLITVAILSLATVGFSLQFGLTNFINIAYGDLMTLAAYFWYTITYRMHLGLWVGGLLAILVVGTLSVLLNRLIFQPIMRRGARPFTLMIATLGISILILNGIVIFWGPLFFSVQIAGNSNIHILVNGASAAIARIDLPINVLVRKRWRPTRHIAAMTMTRI